MSYAYGAPLYSTNDLRGRDSVDLLARVIYDEAENQSWKGKQAVAAVVANRKKCNKLDFNGLNTVEEVILKENAFAGVTDSSPRLLRPNTSSQAWNDSLYIAMNSGTQDNPIGKCLFFKLVTYYNNEHFYIGQLEYIKVGLKPSLVIYKTQIEDHMFYNVEEYNY